ncbi:MAG: hypothetical protein RLY93_18290 [Sumerlaeia bacterium]
MRPRFRFLVAILAGMLAGAVAPVAAQWAPTAAFLPLREGPRHLPVGYVTALFDQEVTGLGREDVTLTRDGAPVDLAVVPMEFLDGREVRLLLCAVTREPGAYVLRIEAEGAGIASLSGDAYAVPAELTFTIHAPAPENVIAGYVLGWSDNASLPCVAQGPDANRDGEVDSADVVRDVEALPAALSVGETPTSPVPAVLAPGQDTATFVFRAEAEGASVGVDSVLRASVGRVPVVDWTSGDVPVPLAAGTHDLLFELLALDGQLLAHDGFRWTAPVDDGSSDGLVLTTVPGPYLPGQVLAFVSVVPLDGATTLVAQFRGEAANLPVTPDGLALFTIPPDTPAGTFDLAIAVPGREGVVRAIEVAEAPPVDDVKGALVAELDAMMAAIEALLADLENADAQHPSLPDLRAALADLARERGAVSALSEDEALTTLRFLQANALLGEADDQKALRPVHKRVVRYAILTYSSYQAVIAFTATTGVTGGLGTVGLVAATAALIYNVSELIDALEAAYDEFITESNVLTLLDEKGAAAAETKTIAVTSGEPKRFGVNARRTNCPPEVAAPISRVSGVLEKIATFLLGSETLDSIRTFHRAETIAEADTAAYRIESGDPHVGVSSNASGPVLSATFTRKDTAPAGDYGFSFTLVNTADGLRTPYRGVFRESSTIEVVTNDYQGRWTLEASGGFVFEGRGTRTVASVPPGACTLTAHELTEDPSMDLPFPAVHTFTLPPNERVTRHLNWRGKEGQLYVVIKPAEVETIARWRIDGGGETNGHIFLEGTGTTRDLPWIPAGRYFIGFDDIEGWQKPRIMAYTLEGASIAPLTGQYLPGDQPTPPEIRITPTPDEGAWILTGPGGYRLEGQGTRSLVEEMPLGDYTLTALDNLAGLDLKPPLPIIKQLESNTFQLAFEPIWTELSPGLLIADPSTDIILSAETTQYVFYGTANFPAQELGNVRWRIGSKRWHDMGPIPSWSFVAGELEEGVNTIEVQALLGNGPYVASVKRIITRGTPRVRVTIDSPEVDPWYPLSTTSVRFFGSAEALEGTIRLVEWGINGGNWQAASGTNAWDFIVPYLIDNSTTLIEVRAWTEEGAVSRVESRRVTKADVDVTITSPPESTIITPWWWYPSGEITISGQASSKGAPISEVLVSEDYQSSWYPADGAEEWSYSQSQFGTSIYRTFFVQAFSFDGKHSPIISQSIYKGSELDIVQCEPENPAAGEEAHVFYNPRQRPLENSPEVMARFLFKKDLSQEAVHEVAGTWTGDEWQFDITIPSDAKHDFRVSFFDDEGTIDAHWGNGWRVKIFYDILWVDDFSDPAFTMSYASVAQTYMPAGVPDFGGTITIENGKLVFATTAPYVFETGRLTTGEQTISWGWPFDFAAVKSFEVKLDLLIKDPGLFQQTPEPYSEWGQNLWVVHKFPYVYSTTHRDDPNQWISSSYSGAMGFSDILNVRSFDFYDPSGIPVNWGSTFGGCWMDEFEFYFGSEELDFPIRKLYDWDPRFEGDLAMNSGSRLVLDEHGIPRMAYLTNGIVQNEWGPESLNRRIPMTSAEVRDPIQTQFFAWAFVQGNDNYIVNEHVSLHPIRMEADNLEIRARILD